MASMFCVKGFRKDDPKQAAFHVEPIWWPRDEIRKDPRMISEGTMFDDYEARLTGDEARELHERYRHSEVPEKFSDEHWRKVIQPRLRTLDSALIQNPDEYSHFLIAIYEWDSGM
jgi:hypothetical protein